MAPTRTIKNKHAGGGKSSSSSKSKGSSSGGGSSGGGITKTKSRSGSKSGGKKGPIVASQVKGRPNLPGLDKSVKKKKKARVYTDKELGIPSLNMVTPVGVTKPKGKKKGKVFVDDKESMTTILALVQAEKEGQIESKLIRARQMEEIREARKAEAEKKEAERKAKLEETKEVLRKKRKRNSAAAGGGGNKKDEDEVDKSVKELAAAGTKAAKGKKKRVSFAAE